MSRNSLALNSHSLRHPPTIVNSIRKIIRDTVKRLKHNDKYFNISIPSKDGNIILLKSDVMKLIRLLDIKYNGSFKTKNGITLMITRYTDKLLGKKTKTNISVLSFKTKDNKYCILGILGYNIFNMPKWIKHFNQYIRLSQMGKILIIELPDNIPLNSLSQYTNLSPATVNISAQVSAVVNTQLDTNLVPLVASPITSLDESSLDLIIKSPKQLHESECTQIVEKTDHESVVNLVDKRIGDVNKWKIDNIVNHFTFDSSILHSLFYTGLIYSIINIIYWYI